MDRREEIIHTLLGRMVRVVVDRPVGCRNGDILYPINYGEVPGVTAGDGEPQDVYILGVSEPLSTFEGRVIAAVRRRDDCEDKLVAAPEGMVFHQGEIAAAVQFQERYFDSSIDSRFRKSCGVIPFRQTAAGREFLLLLQTNGCWSFPKGHMEAGETEEETALRELREETGLEAALVPGARAVSEYDIPPRIHKQVVLFPGEVRGDLRLQTEEIAGHCWVRGKELQDYLFPDTYDACKALL